MIIFFFLILFFGSNVNAIDIDNSDVNSTLTIIPENNISSHNDNFYFGIKINLDDGWKTYWKNPGDAGSGIKLKMENQKNILDYKILYPFPKSYTDHGVKTIGYENEVVFPIELQVKEKAKKIYADIYIEYLICKEICIPINEKRTISYKIKKKLSQNNQILKYLDRVPKSELGIIKFTEVFARDKNNFFMVMNNPQEKKIEIFPFSNETQLTLKSQHLGKKTKFYFESEESLKSLKKPVEFSVSDGMKSEKIFINLSETPVKENVIKFLFFAFIGGIILNFMPCVFPVLSIKVMSMIQLKEVEKLQIKKFSFLVISGITFSFIFLAITLITLKSLGIFVGWGFQFQNIYFLIFLSLIILLFSLNLLGFFEIILPNSLSNFFDKLGRKENASGYFFSGMFATLMATPCSAPFLGTAIGFASLTSNLNIVLIFLFISLGFSIPYFLIVFKPSFLNFLPKPGLWMVNFKYFLGFILLLTFSWLLSVIGVNLLVNIFLFITILFSSILIIKKDNITFLKTVIALTASGIFLFLFLNRNENIIWEKFDEELITNYNDNNNLIFVDFTADWCVTCQFNKITTLDNKKVIRFFLENDVKLIRGDWTKKDEKILNFIKKYERFGVPVNIIYSKNMKEGLVLPEILSKSNIIDNFERIK